MWVVVDHACALYIRYVSLCYVGPCDHGMVHSQVGAIFEKIEILHFFLCELPLILWVVENKKTARDICERTPDIVFERDRLIGLGSAFSDGKIDTHTQTFFSKTHI